VDVVAGLDFARAAGGCIAGADASDMRPTRHKFYFLEILLFFYQRILLLIRVCDEQNKNLKNIYYISSVVIFLFFIRRKIKDLSHRISFSGWDEPL